MNAVSLFIKEEEFVVASELNFRSEKFLNYFSAYNNLACIVLWGGNQNKYKNNKEHYTEFSMKNLFNK